MNIACIYREPRFSPNMADADAAILDAVAQRLSAHGHVVTHDADHAQMVFSMARSVEKLSHLRQAEGRGVRVINSTQAIDNCNRTRFTNLFIQHHIPMPPSIVCTAMPTLDLNYPLWIKKGEGYSERPDDVVFATDPDAATQAIHQMLERGVESVVVNQHAVGDLVKFYGVRGTNFFRWYYAADGHSKFGLESVNGKQQGYEFDLEGMMHTCNHAAEVLGLDVYGGDCVISSDGTFQIIDFNDWPSFSRFRDDAAEAIANLVVKQ